MTKFEGMSVVTSNYLYEMLVVPHPDCANMIAMYIDRVLLNRDKIISAYSEYAKSYNEWCVSEYWEFVEV